MKIFVDRLPSKPSDCGFYIPPTLVRDNIYKPSYCVLTGSKCNLKNNECKRFKVLEVKDE